MADEGGSVTTAIHELGAICNADYLSRSSQNQTYCNEDIETVARLLVVTNQESWAGIPRLYIVLRNAELLDLRHYFLSIHHTDAHFPYSALTLPKGIEIEKRNKFLRVQTCVLAGSNQVSKWTLGEHVHFASPEQVPLEPKAILGTGGSGQVEVVALRSQTRTAHPAFDKRLVRKLIRRRVFGPHQQGLAVFKNELEVLKRLQHRHLVEIIGSYTDPTFAALIMSPVADYDLAYFMKIATTDNQKLSSLRTFFGCLATALAYLHKMRIRHKDIKPPNILVHDTNVLITDFGLARDCNDTRSTTEGPTGRTPKYAAPEVVEYAPRNFSSDIWSLGCVYLEMLTVSEGNNLDQLKHFMSENGTQNIHYHANVDGVGLWILELRNGPNGESIGGLLDWIQVMLMPDRDLRPSADTLAAEIANTQSSSGRIGEFCGICCREEDVYFTDVEMEGDSLFIPESLTNALGLEDVKVIQSMEDPMETASRFEMEDARPLEPSRDHGIRISASGSRPRPAVLMHEASRNTLPMTPESESGLPISVPRSESFDRTLRDLFLPRFVVLRSNSAVDIETSCAFQVWTCSRNTNLRLNKWYKETQLDPQSDLYLLFSVVESRKFCGVARMASEVDFTTTLPHWESIEWEGNFNLEWKSTLEIDYDNIRHLRMKEGGEGMQISGVMSGMEICYSSGVEMMRRFQVQGF